MNEQLRFDTEIDDNSMGEPDDEVREIFASDPEDDDDTETSSDS